MGWNDRHEPREEPDYSGGTPERHAPRGDGLIDQHGGDVNGSNYRQPWVKHDGVTDPTGDKKIG